MEIVSNSYRPPEGFDGMWVPLDDAMSKWARAYPPSHWGSPGVGLWTVVGHAAGANILRMLWRNRLFSRAGGRLGERDFMQFTTAGYIARVA